MNINNIPRTVKLKNNKEKKVELYKQQNNFLTNKFQKSVC